MEVMGQTCSRKHSQGKAEKCCEKEKAKEWIKLDVVFFCFEQKLRKNGKAVVAPEQFQCANFIPSCI